jgi:protein O-GlcNAc transferase
MSALSEIQEALRHLGSGRPDEAVTLLARVRQQHPTDADVLRGLGVALERAGKLSEAVEVWTQLSALQPQSAEAEEHRALLGDSTHNTALSLDARRKLAQRLSGSPEVLADLGVALSRAGQHAEAVRAFEKALVLDPSFLDRAAVERRAYETSKAQQQQGR